MPRTGLPCRRLGERRQAHNLAFVCCATMVNMIAHSRQSLRLGSTSLAASAALVRPESWRLPGHANSRFFANPGAQRRSGECWDLRPEGMCVAELSPAALRPVNIDLTVPTRGGPCHGCRVALQRDAHTPLAGIRQSSTLSSLQGAASGCSCKSNHGSRAQGLTPHVGSL